MLRIENVGKSFTAGGGLFGARTSVTALRGVSLHVAKGESFGLVGESGSGKTTLARCVMMLDQVTEGRILFDGVDLSRLNRRDMRAMRARIQIVFQDPYASLNPRMTIRDTIAEPMEIHRARLGRDARGRTDRVVELLELVGLSATHLHRYPHEFSGGQRQRIGIARALAPGPDLLVLDEPTSALDVSVQAQILTLLNDLRERFQLTTLFISHDLGVVRYLCDQVAFLHHGQLVEQGATETVFAAPTSTYARTLLHSVPNPDPDQSFLNRGEGWPRSK
jgi:ABC-type glutathione transport system ATPase component